MEGILKVTPTELISVAGDFSTKSNTIGTLTTEMMNLVTGLTSVWEGDAATAYITKFRGLEDDIQLMIRMVQEHSSDLQEMANTYIPAEAANSESANELSSDVII